MKNLTRRSFIGVGASAAMAAALVGCSSGSGSSKASSASASASGSASASASSASASASSASASAAASSAAAGALRFVTGGESGTYYAFGSVIAQHCTNNTNVAVTALVGNGSQSNVLELEDKNAELAFCQSDVMAYAYDGTNLFEGMPVTCFSTVAALYDEQVQIVTCNESIKTVADLKGKNVSIGAAGSGVYFNAIDILGAYDITEKDISATFQSFGDSADSLKDGKIDAAFIVAGAPTTAITDLSTSKTAYLVALDDEHIKKLVEKSPYYSETTIKANTYPGQTADVKTVSVNAVILAQDSVAEDAVYTFTKDIFDNAASLTDSHAKYAELSVEKGASVTSVPYHPGAAKYFTEKGQTVKSK